MIYAGCVAKEDMNTLASFRLLDELNTSITANLNSELQAYKKSGKGYNPSHWLHYRNSESEDSVNREHKFFSVAIKASLSDYLEYKLNNGELDMHMKRSRPLLSYCTGDFSSYPSVTKSKGDIIEHGYFPDPRVVEVLLRYGADPEELWIDRSINNKQLSIRGKLLQNGLRNFRDLSLRRSESSTISRDRWIKIAKLMLQHSVKYKAFIIRKERSKMTSLLYEILGDNDQFKKEFEELIDIIDI